MPLVTVTIRQEGLRVQVIRNGRLVFEIPWQDALEFSHAMREKANLAATCERYMTETESVEQDQELLIKRGVPLNLGVPRKRYGDLLRDHAIRSMAVVGRPHVKLELPHGQRSGTENANP
jgi:hypothetical protein